LSITVGGLDILQIVKVVVALFITYVVARIVSKTLEKVFEKTPFPEQIERSIVRVSKYVVYIIGFFAIISLTGVDLTSLLVGLGAFSIAISFATSNIIQNLVSGILVIGDREFTVGDHIRIQSFEGRVVKIGIRTTIIETTNGDLVFIPNSIFITNPVTRRSNRAEES
jgi:small-conductance mechanosensitive channel